MTTAWLLLLSGVLIGAGVSLIVRDVARGQYGALPFAWRLRPDRAAGAGTAAVEAAATAEGADRMSLAQQWAALAPVLEAAVTGVNRLLAPDQLAIGEMSAADWSYRQRGYGAHRRLRHGEDSIAWLRLELTADGRLQASLRAHRENRAEINASAERPAAALTVAQATELLLACVRPAARVIGPLRPGPSTLPGPHGPVIDSALKATNGALAAAGARLVLLPAEAAPAPGAQSVWLCVEVDGREVGRVQITDLGDGLEVAASPSGATPAELARRRHLTREGMTIHALAEAIAACAWPAIAHNTAARNRLSK